jgi:hypothetical protein
MLRDIAVARSDDAGRTFQSAVVSHDGWDIDAAQSVGRTRYRNSYPQKAGLLSGKFLSDHQS